MITVLDTLGPAIWRASWQAAALAVLVVLLLRCFGERLSPRWRFLMWGVVLTRLLLRGDSRQPLERVQSRPPESGGRTADRSPRGRCNAHAGSAQARPDDRPGRNEP